MSKEVFKIASQYGGKDVFKVVSPLFRRLKPIVSEFEGKKYCNGIDYYSFVIRADGEIQQFEFEGLECLELDEKNKSITIDIGLPHHRWEGRTDKEIIDYLGTILLEGLDEMLKKFKEKEIEIDEKQIKLDFNEAVRKWGAGL